MVRPQRTGPPYSHGRMAAPRDDMPPDRNLALELVRVTEAAALQAARLVGMGDKAAADQAAIDGMHAMLHTIHRDAVLLIGEGEKTRRRCWPTERSSATGPHRTTTRGRPAGR